MAHLLDEADTFEHNMDLFYDLTTHILCDTSALDYMTYDDMVTQHGRWHDYVHLTCDLMLSPLSRQVLADLNMRALYDKLMAAFPFHRQVLPSLVAQLDKVRMDPSLDLCVPPLLLDTVRHRYLSALALPKNLAELNREKALCNRIAPDLCERMITCVFHKCTTFMWDADFVEMLVHLCVTQERLEDVKLRMLPVRKSLEDVNKAFPTMMNAVARAPALARRAEWCVQPRATGDELYQAIDTKAVTQVVARRCYETMVDTDLFEHIMCRNVEQRLVSRGETKHLLDFVQLLMPSTFKSNVLRMFTSEQALERYGVLVARGWRQSLQEADVPEEFLPFCGRAIETYQGDHPDRRLQVSMRVGRVVLRVRGVRVRCAPIAAVTLLRMRDGMTVKELMVAAKCDVHVVFSLVHPKNGVLQKRPNTSVMDPAHQLRFHPKLNQVMPTAPTRDLVMYKCKRGKEDGTVEARMLAEQRFRTLQANLVRLFKTKKCLEHSQVIVEVTALGLQHHPRTVKKALEELIDKEYLERAPDNRALYKYIA